MKFIENLNALFSKVRKNVECEDKFRFFLTYICGANLLLPSTNEICPFQVTYYLKRWGKKYDEKVEIGS